MTGHGREHEGSNSVAVSDNLNDLIEFIVHAGAEGDEGSINETGLAQCLRPNRLRLS